MAREVNRLTARKIAALREPGLHADGAGLYLRIDQTASRRWVYVFYLNKRRREMGLGSASAVDLERGSPSLRRGAPQGLHGYRPDFGSAAC